MKISSKLKTVKLSDIRPYKNNPKVHTADQVELVKKSIQENSYIQPIVVDKNNEIVIGHCRFQAMYDYIRSIWNSPNAAKSPYKYFGGILVR